MGKKKFCMHGCYPVDKNWHYKDGLPVESIRDFLGDQEDAIMEKIEEEGVEKIEDIADLAKVTRIVRNNSESLDVKREIGEDILKKMKETLPYGGGGEPYVTSDKRTIVIGSSSQGFAMDAYLFLVDILDFRYDYDVHKVKEFINVAKQSQLYQEMNERKRRAQESINKALSTLSDLYQQKHLLEHDVRKLRERVKSFDKAEEGREEALKADFVDLVDQHTGKSSIVQMQANNVFPTITADFYRMESEDDLDDPELLGSVPESEKAMLRKKWQLYQRWKEEFGKNVRSKLKDLEMRLNSIKTSIEQTEKSLRPYVRTLKEVQSTDREVLNRITDKFFLKGYSTSWRDMKLVCVKKRGSKGNYREVLVVNIEHQSIAGSSQPQAPGAGGEGVVFHFDAYLVCEHVFKEVFEPQINLMKNEVKEYIQRYQGLEEVDVHKESLEGIEKPNRWKNKILKIFGEVDDYYKADPTDLRATEIGPPHEMGLYLDIKYGCGLFVMD